MHLGKGKGNFVMNKFHYRANILIIDDDPDFVTSTKNILESKHYRVEVAYNLKEAMDKLSKEKPDLILLDIMLEKLSDGFTICYRIKHDPELKHIPVFALSGITEKTGLKLFAKTEEKYFKPDQYAEKPITAAALLQCIGKLLKNRRKGEEQ